MVSVCVKMALPLQSSEDLQEQFFDVWTKYKKIIDDISTKDNEFKICIELINMLLSSIIKKKMFSSNETIDDVNTENLKFGLLPHFLSELYTNRNIKNRISCLDLSDKYGKLFINQCEIWEILKKRERKIYDKLINNLNNKNKEKEKINVFQQRTEIVETHKLNLEKEKYINDLIKKKSYLKKRNKDHNWKLFNEEEDERDYWLSLFQISIRNTIKTIKYIYIFLSFHIFT